VTRASTGGNSSCEQRIRGRGVDPPGRFGEYCRTTTHSEVIHLDGERACRAALEPPCPASANQSIRIADAQSIAALWRESASK